MIDPILREAIIVDAFQRELVKIGNAVTAAMPDPGDIARMVRENAGLRQQAAPDLLQKLRPNTGSFFGAVKDRFDLARSGWRTQGMASDAFGQMTDQANPMGAQNVFQENERLRRLAQVRQAEAQAHGVGLRGQQPGTQSSFFGSSASPPQATPARNSTLRNVAFGTGLGAAGIVGAQTYLNQRQQQPYEM